MLIAENRASFQPSARIVGALVGATAVGKTALSLAMADQLGAEIISADSRQIYAGIPIGTAQPSAVELAQVPHHFIGTHPPGELFSAGEYLRQVRELLENNADKKYLVVGGTGMYVKVLLEGISTLPPTDSQLRERLYAVKARRGVQFLQRWAAQIDPAGWQALLSGDTYRLLRLLEVYIQTGQPWSSYVGQRTGGVGPFPVLWLDRPREHLYANINARVAQMIQQGWEDEVRQLAAQAGVGCAAFQSLGYTELWSSIAGEIPRDQAIAEIQKSTRNFAKRQLTWFRHQLPSMRLDIHGLSPAQQLEKALLAL